MTHKERVEFFQLLRAKFDEIEDLMESFGGKENFLSAYCVGIFVPETDESSEKYELLTGMHMAMEDELDLMINTISDAYEQHKDDPDKGDPGYLDYWLN